jgi:hypothetical protein
LRREVLQAHGRLQRPLDRQQVRLQRGRHFRENFS